MSHDGLSRPGNRELFLQLHKELQTQSRFRILGFSDEMYERGLKLWGERQDKERSLTDCISFVPMQERIISDALTGDRHFEQAGFRALLK
jgi:predicted nucleic acid-binding protein